MLSVTGPDKGDGGKYLLLPPGYDGEVPEGCFVVKSPTYNLWLPYCIYLKDGSPKAGIEQAKKTLKTYPLADRDKPAPELKYPDLSGKPFNISVRPHQLPVLGIAQPGSPGGAGLIVGPDSPGLDRLTRGK